MVQPLKTSGESRTHTGAALNPKAGSKNGSSPTRNIFSDLVGGEFYASERTIAAINNVSKGATHLCVSTCVIGNPMVYA